MNKNIIGIFGGTGFLGLELVSVLSKSGFQVKVFSRNASEEKSINLIVNKPLLGWGAATFPIIYFLQYGWIKPKAFRDNGRKPSI